MTLSAINLAALDAAPVIDAPFPHVILPGFIRHEALAAIEADYPIITKPGSFPLPILTYGEHFQHLMEAISSPEMTSIIAQKFDVDLTYRPTMITVRGQCRTTDGQIHTDSKTKLITVLIYMNGRWEEPGGRLRLLRSPNDLDDYAVELPPDQGTLLVFKNQANAWHGHEPFVGQRRAIQLNWVRSSGVVWREQWRHRVSAFFKNL